MARSHSLCLSLSWKEPSVKSSSSRQNPSKHRVLPSFSPSGHYQLSFGSYFSLLAIPQVSGSLLFFKLPSAASASPLLYFPPSKWIQNLSLFIIWIFLSHFVCLSKCCAVCLNVWWVVFRFSGSVFTFFCTERVFWCQINKNIIENGLWLAVHAELFL